MGRMRRRVDREAVSELEQKKRREIVQLLKDLRPFYSPFGGATPLDSTLNLEAAGAYGPAGLIFAGTEFEREDRTAIRNSFFALAASLVKLQQQESVGKHEDGENISGSGAYFTFIEPYLGDPADASIVGDWRKKAADGSLISRRFIERHDAGIDWLVQDLWSTELHVVFPKLMSEKEEAEIEHQYAEMYAVFQRLRVSGLKVQAAMAQTAENFNKVPISVIERVVEFHSKEKLDTCSWGDCERAPFSQMLCMKHYAQQRRIRKKNAS
jgi:hypothetical protein